MDAVIEQDQDPLTLQTQLVQARAKLDDVVRHLQAIDGELAGLATERDQHRLLNDICASLTRLDEVGGARLFWGDDTADGHGANHLRRLRARVQVFQERLDEVESRRQAVLAQIDQHEGQAYLLEDELFEAQEEEERRRQEWIVEREVGAAVSRQLIMPWARGGADDVRFRKTMATSLAICLLFALILPFVDLPVLDLSKPMAVPDRVVRMMMEKRPVPPPRQESAPPVKEERVAEQKPVEQVAPEKTPRPEKPEVAQVEQPAPAKGLLAFREKLAASRETKVSARLGLEARISNADDSSGPPERSMLTTNAAGTSGGINLAALSRGLGGAKGNGGSGAMAGVQVSRAKSSIGGGGGATDRPLASGGPGLSRTDEEIQIVFDRYKASLYRLYNRELRKDPTLRGQMVLRLTIEPDGSVSMCALQSSDMNAPELSAQLVDRVRTINFGAKDVMAMTIVYPIDFLPAA
jgi:hypothetical protein